MSNAVVKKSVQELDGFNDFTSEVEGDENINVSSKVIQGTKIKFIDPRWLAGEKDITGKMLTAIGVLNVVNKWGPDDRPLEPPRILAPGERFPNFGALNAQCDRSEWRERFGKMTGPYSGQHCVYFVDENLNRFTWPSPLTTIGSAIAVSELVDQIKLVRRFRGLNAYPVVELGHTNYPTGYGLKQRPHLLKIREWVELGFSQAAELPAPDSNSTPEISKTGGAPAGAQSVTPVTLAEEADDEIPF
jgi:hypothetical protein